MRSFGSIAQYRAIAAQPEVFAPRRGMDRH